MDKRSFTLIMVLTIAMTLAASSALPRTTSRLDVFKLASEKDGVDEGYCGNCCGWDVHCNKRSNPFITENDPIQTVAGVSGGQLQGLKNKDSDMSLHYLCFYCCGRYWYCNP